MYAIELSYHHDINIHIISLYPALPNMKKMMLKTMKMIGMPATAIFLSMYRNVE